MKFIIFVLARNKNIFEALLTCIHVILKRVPSELTQEHFRCKSSDLTGSNASQNINETDQILYTRKKNMIMDGFKQFGAL